jgi:hypothetical protein
VLQCLYKIQPIRLLKATFVFDSSMAVSLSLVATKCRDHVVRRRAINLLLAHPRREGFWDITGRASVATCLMKKEEEGPGHLLKVDQSIRERGSAENGGACSKSSTKGTKEREELPEMTISW